MKLNLLIDLIMTHKILLLESFSIFFVALSIRIESSLFFFFLLPQMNYCSTIDGSRYHSLFRL